MNQLEKIEAARYRLSTEATYLNRVLWSMQLIETDKVPTLGVDKYWRLYYNPDFAPEMTVQEMKAIIAHECNHLLRDHAGRCPTGTDPNEWNICADAEINDDLKEEGWQLPGQPMARLEPGQEGYILPECLPAPDNLTAEEYMQILRRDRPDLYEDMAMPGDENSPGGGNCGSAAHGQGEDYEKDKQDGETPGMSEVEKELIRRMTAKEILDHQKQTGNNPMGLGRWAEELLNSRIPWQQEISAMVRYAVGRAKGAKDYTYRNPDFRRKTGDFILPSLYEPVPNVTIVVDTSGSISQRELTMAITEIKAILTKVMSGEGIHVIACDAAVHSTQKVFDVKQISKLAGGGGTDMGVGIARADELRSDVTIVLTDGYTPWPQSPPRTRVIVGLIGNNAKDSVPEWAKCVLIEED